MAEFDAERANELLDVVHKTLNIPSLKPLQEAASDELAKMAAAVAEALRKEAEEAKKKAEAEDAKKAAEEKSKAEAAERHAKQQESRPHA